MDNSQSQFLCVNFLTGSCTYPVCKNIHPQNIEHAVTEYKQKEPITKICRNYNSPNGCKFSTCKFLHIHNGSNIKPMPIINKNEKIESQLNPLRISITKLEDLITEYELYASKTGTQTPPEVLKMRDQVYENINILRTTIDNNLKMIRTF